MGKSGIKKALKIVAWVVGVFIALDLLLVGLLFVPAIQTFVVHKVTESLSEAWGTEISIKDIHITPTLKLVAHEVAIKDHHNENMIYSGTLRCRLRKIKTNPAFTLGLGDVEFDNLDVVLRTYKDEDTVNISKWCDIFASDEPSGDFKLTSNTVDITNGRFVYIDDNDRVVFDTVGQPDIDYSFFELANLNISARDFLLVNDDITMQLDRLAFTQYGGFNLKNLSADFHISGKDLTLNNMRLQTDKSDLDMDLLFLYDEWTTYAEFMDSVYIGSNIRPSVLSMDDIADFAPAIRGMDEVFLLQADTVDGIVNDFRVEALKVLWNDRNLVQGNFAIRDVVDFFNAYFDVDIDSADFYLPDLERFTLPGGNTIPTNSLYRKIGAAALAGTFKGTLDDFNARLRTSSGIGNINGNINTTSADGRLAFSGDISSNNLRLGLLTSQNKMLGNCHLQASFEGKTASTGFTAENLKTLDAHLKGHVTRFPLLGYPLCDIDIEGDYRDRLYNARLLADDPNIQCNAIAQLDLTQAEPYLQGNINSLNFCGGKIGALLPLVDTATAKGVDKVIMILQQNPSLNLSCDNFQIVSHGSDLTNLNGFLGCDNLKLVLKEDSMSNERLRLTAINKEDIHKYILSSNIVNATVESNFPILAVVDTLQNMAHNLFPSIIPASKNHQIYIASNDTVVQSAYVKLNMTTYNTRTITKLFAPNMFIAPNSSINLDIRSDHAADIVDVNLPFFSIRNKVRLHNFQLNGTSTNANLLNLQVSGDSVLVNVGQGKLLFDKLDIQASSSNNIVHYDIAWHNAFNANTNISKLQGMANLSHKEDIIIQLQPSKVYLKDYECHFNDQNAIHIMPHKFEFDNLTFFTHNSAVTLNGNYDTKDSSRLTMSARSIDLSLINPLLNEGSAIGGWMSANLNLVHRNNKRLIYGKLIANELNMNDTRLGDLFLILGLNNDNDVRFSGGLFNSSSNNIDYDYLTQYSIQNFKEESDIIADVTGTYSKKRLSANAVFDSLEVGFLAPFLTSFSDYFMGNASGDLSLIVSPDSTYINGTVHVDTAQMGIEALGTRYIITDQDILFTQEGITFNNMEIKDKDGNTAALVGNIRHNMFQDMQIELQIQTDRLLVLNSPRNSNAFFYGTGYVMGNVHIFGDTDHLSFVGPNIRTLSGSRVVLQVSSTSSATETNLIHFQTRPNETVEEETVQEKEPSTMNLDFDFTFDVTNDADIVLILESLDGVMNARADGRFQLVYRDEELSLFGNLLLHSGDFKMSLMDVVNPKFTMLPGGSISFDGPLETMTVNLSAYKSSKTSLANIVPTEFLDGTADVNAYIHLNGHLMQHIDPTFSFELPNSSAEVRNMFYTAIDTQNTENMTKQFAYFLVTNSFMPESMFSGWGNGLSGIGLFSNMVNNLLSNVIDSKKASFGITYNQATETTSAEYGLKANANLFKDRVSMSTSIGYYDDRKAEAALNNIYGDLTVEYNINRSGTWRLKAFTYIGNRDRTYIYENPNLYTAGVALAYKQDFDRVRKKKSNQRQNSSSKKATRN